MRLQELEVLGLVRRRLGAVAVVRATPERAVVPERDPHGGRVR
jgi:hypothetical protein